MMNELFRQNNTCKSFRCQRASNTAWITAAWWLAFRLMPLCITLIQVVQGRGRRMSATATCSKNCWLLLALMSSLAVGSRASSEIGMCASTQAYSRCQRIAVRSKGTSASRRIRAHRLRHGSSSTSPPLAKSAATCEPLGPCSE